VFGRVFAAVTSVDLDLALAVELELELWALVRVHPLDRARGALVDRRRPARHRRAQQFGVSVRAGESERHLGRKKKREKKDEKKKDFFSIILFFLLTMLRKSAPESAPRSCVEK
jgi:hypothetical protein